jgi:gamma-glutamyltranspeptidase/glutathione hydrolase
MFVRDGKADTRLSQVGALASGTPGALAAYDLALSKYGKLPLKDHLLAAAQIAEEGFPINDMTMRRLRSEAEDLARFEASASIFRKPDGTPWTKGDILKQPDLAATYRHIAEHGTGWFYGGPFAEAAAKWMAENGGLLTVEDFRNYRAIVREPVRGTYRGHEIVSFPPPSSGGVHVVQILNMLEPFDLRSMGAGSVGLIHTSTEAMKLAFADRAHWLGDPDFVPVPRGLISREYAQSLGKAIDPERSTKIPTHGTPENSTTDIFNKHTTHLSTADAEGNWVACTATINTAFGSKVVVPGTGVMLNNEMDDFSAQPGVPNAFGLVGGEANAVAPGKRPLSSMSPTIVLKDGQPMLSVGAAGGPTIITQTLLTIINTIDFEQDLETAVGSPRWHHQWLPDELRIERKVPEEVRAAVREKGHTLSEIGRFGVTQAVCRLPDGTFVGVADPRAEGAAAAH